MSNQAQTTWAEAWCESCDWRPDSNKRRPAPKRCPICEGKMLPLEEALRVRIPRMSREEREHMLDSLRQLLTAIETQEDKHVPS